VSVYDDLVGQGQVIEQLRAATTVLGRMTHAWLFTGPPGSGRSVAARAFAAALLCDHGVAGDSEPGCGECPSCRQVLAGSHADVQVVRPAGLSYGVRETRELVLRAASAPSGGRWRIVLFEDADRATEQAANALLKAIEEPPPKTVWLLCTPAPDDLVVTIRSRCRLVTLRTPGAEAVAEVLVRRDGIDPAVAAEAARAAQGHIGRARRLATDAEARSRRAEILAVPGRLTGVGPSVDAAAKLVAAADAEAKRTSEELDQRETEALKQALGTDARGRALRGTAGALKDLEDRQKSRATRVKRDALDRTLLDLAAFYRDVLMVQMGADVELVNADRMSDLTAASRGWTPEDALRRLEAIMECRERLTANVNPLLAVEAMTVALQV
jgi:DNA polymerase-3 subunit delta'